MIISTLNFSELFGCGSAAFAKPSRKSCRNPLQKDTCAKAEKAMRQFVSENFPPHFNFVFPLANAICSNVQSFVDRVKNGQTKPILVSMKETPNLDELEQAKALFYKKEYKEAFEILNRMVDKDPSDFRALSYRANVHFHLGSYSEARNDATALLDSCRNENRYSAQASYLLGKICIREGNPTQALVHFLEAERMNPQHIKSILGSANAYLLLRNLDMAETAANRALEMIDEDSDSDETSRYQTQAFETLLDVYLSRQNMEKVVEYSQSILELDPENTKAQFHLAFAVCLLEGNESEKRSPSMLGGKIFADTASCRKTNVQAEEILELNESGLLAIFYENQGHAALREERYEEALSFFDKAFELDPKMLYTRAGRAQALAKVGRKEEALVEATHVLESYQVHPNVLEDQALAIVLDLAANWTNSPEKEAAARKFSESCRKGEYQNMRLPEEMRQEFLALFS